MAYLQYTVETNANRIESVTCSKYDSLALSYFRKNNPNIKLLVLTSESNPSVSARCEKLKLPIKSSSVSKRSDLLESLNELSISPACTAFIGNDINDLELFDFLPVTACPNDSPAEVKARANHILEAKGGHGAVREFLELMSSHLSIAAHKPPQPVFPSPKSIGEQEWGEELLLNYVPGSYSLKLLKMKKGAAGDLQKHRLKMKLVISYLARGYLRR